MAHDYHLTRIEMALKRAGLHPDPQVRGTAYATLSKRFEAMVERAVLRDDAIQKNRKKNGTPYNLGVSPAANNSLITAHLLELSRITAAEAARLAPQKAGQGAQGTLVI